MQLIVGSFFWQEHLATLSDGRGGLCGRAANNEELLTAGASIKTLPFVQPRHHRCTQHAGQILNSAKYRVNSIHEQYIPYTEN